LNFLSRAVVSGCLFSGSLLFAQSNHSVSFYQLRHKSIKQARRFCDAATVELKKENYQAGIKLLEHALALDPNYWVAQNNLGFAFLHLQQQERALKAFQRAIEIDPMNAVGYTNLSVVALSRNDFPLAEKSASESLRLDPELPEAKAMLGLALVGQGIWTPVAKKLLEESRGVSTSDMLLKKWPQDETSAPTVVVNPSQFR